MGTDLLPIVRKIDDNIDGLQSLKDELGNHASEKEREVLLDYPTIYIHNWKNNGKYEVYIGESGNIIQRTKQHFDKSKEESAWQYQLVINDASLYIIGHEHFNKSLTLDIENRLMLYLSSVDGIRQLHNKKGNPQRQYFTNDELDDIFRLTWRTLRRMNPSLFPKESAIRDSALYKASPLHRLTEDQEEIKDNIIERVFAALDREETGQIIFIDGEAGTGKTVLNSSTFYEIYERAEDLGNHKLECYLMVNHDQQLNVYHHIAEKFGLINHYGEVVCKPTVFINSRSPEHPVDVAFIDEAHLLWTQGKHTYRGKNQLKDIIERAKVTVVMFDENQILTTEQYWEAQVLNHYRDIARSQGNHFQLTKQLRMNASEETLTWIDLFTKERKITKIPEDRLGYEIKVFNQPLKLEQEIKKRAREKDHGLSRIVATYDWEYKDKALKGKRMQRWEVLIGSWHKPWNYELEKDLGRRKKKQIKNLSWAEQPQTIDEVGSTFTIQGFDLNYVGVILGPSVIYRDGEIQFNPDASFNKKATRNRTLSDGTKKKFGKILIQHELRVLMTRGVNGMYIYACDEALRNALNEAAGKEEEQRE